jgi:predicted amidophosphoribosyltransferase
MCANDVCDRCKRDLDLLLTCWNRRSKINSERLFCLLNDPTKVELYGIVSETLAGTPETR